MSSPTTPEEPTKEAIKAVRAAGSTLIYSSVKDAARILDRFAAQVAARREGEAVERCARAASGRHLICTPESPPNPEREAHNKAVTACVKAIRSLRPAGTGTEQKT